MSEDKPPPDPFEAVKALWSSMGFAMPGMGGMMAPTFDSAELDKRIADLKAVEGWLQMNLGLLQTTLQGLEMQRSALAAMQAGLQSSNKDKT
ncbi:MAG TPA: PhaM family polyhydroxyalkanoate granule multifunctional regulatory protein [Rhodocyclaceae bacterium]|nr:PhaM family polyhydroxyalkanoate granule multifunctional regulatory protein [Rhodocyclaceae bacterium]